MSCVHGPRLNRGNFEINAGGTPGLPDADPDQLSLFYFKFRNGNMEIPNGYDNGVDDTYSEIVILFEHFEWEVDGYGMDMANIIDD